LLSATADKGVQARKHGGGAEESIEKVIASSPKADAAISIFYFDISCSPQDTLRWIFDILYVIPAQACHPSESRGGTFLISPSAKVRH